MEIIAMTFILHTQEQGKRVHLLANLGGLVAIAGLENVDPATLLGALLDVAKRLRQLSMQQLDILHTLGLEKLRERNSEKRAYGKHIAKESSVAKINLNSDDIKKIIIQLGGKIPVFEKDLVPELRRLLR